MVCVAHTCLSKMHLDMKWRNENGGTSGRMSWIRKKEIKNIILKKRRFVFFIFPDRETSETKKLKIELISSEASGL